MVFVGPCLSKIREIREHGESADAVLTFRQLELLLKERDLMDEEGRLQVPPEEPDRASSYSRIYPVPEGILRDVRRQENTVENALAENGLSEGMGGYAFISVCGLENVREFLEELRKGNYSHVFAELNSCEGGCVNGPLIPDSRRAAFRSRRWWSGMPRRPRNLCPSGRQSNGPTNPIRWRKTCPMSRPSAVS